MLSWLINPTALLIILPLMLFFLITFLGKKVLKGSKISVQIAADFSTFFFILADHLFIQLLFGKSVLLYLLLVLFLLGIVVVIFYAKKHGEINFLKVLRSYWRVCFVLAFLCYMMLFLFGLISSLFHLF